MNRKIKIVFLVLLVGLIIVPYLDVMIFSKYANKDNFGTDTYYFTRTLVEFLIFIGGIYAGKNIWYPNKKLKNENENNKKNRD